MTAPQMAVWVIERDDGEPVQTFKSEREALAFFRLDLYDQSEYRVVQRWAPFTHPMTNTPNPRHAARLRAAADRQLEAGHPVAAERLRAHADGRRVGEYPADATTPCSFCGSDDHARGQDSLPHCIKEQAER